MATRSSFALFFLVNTLLVFINVSLHAMSIAITVECRYFADNYFFLRVLSIIQILLALLLYLSVMPISIQLLLCLKNDADCRHRHASDWHYVSYD